MTNKKYLDLNSLKDYHSKLKPVIESKANSSEVYNKTDVYTKDQVDSALDSKSNVGHTHDQYLTEQNVYTKEQVDAALESKSDISHTHDQYLTDIGIDISFNGSETLKGTATDYKILGVDSTKTYYLSGTKFIGTGCTDVTITPIIGTSATCTYDEETGIVSWTIYGTSSSGPVSANLSWTGAPGILTSTKDGIKTTVGYFNTINGESIVSTTETKNFDVYNKSEIDTKLSAKADASNVYTTSQVDNKLSEKADISDVYTTAQVDSKLSTKADTSNVYNKSTIDTKLNAKANSSDVYTKNQVDNKLNTKANASDVYTATTIDAKLNLKANSSDVYTKSQVDTKLNAKANSSDVYTTTQIDTKLNGKSDISHDHDADYVSNVSMAPSSSGSKWVSGIPGDFSTDFGDGPVYPVSGTTNIGVGLDERNITITPGEGAKSATGSYDSSTGDYSWTLHGKAGNTKANGRISWNSGDNQLKVTKDGTTRTVGYFNTINGESVISSDSSKNFSFYTNAEINTKLSAKADASNVYSKSDVDTALNTKANASDVYTSTTIDAKLNLKANSSDVYTKSQVDTKLNAKANASGVYTKTETNNLINSKTKTVVFDTYNKFIEFLEDTSQATYDYFNVGDSIYIKAEGSDYWISGKEDIVEDGDAYRYISGKTGSELLGTDNIFRTTVTENIGTTYTSVTVDGIEPSDGSCNYSNFSWNSSTGVVKITLESLQPNKNVTARLKCHVSASGGGDYGYYYISNIGQDISRKADKATTLSGYGITNAYTKTEVDNKLSGKANKATTLSGYGITNAYTKTETDNKLNGKSDVGHSHESILDYGNTSNTIKIGYRGNGLTASQIEYIAGYTAGDNANEHKIKDISKDVLKTWLGYAEVTTGVFSPGTTLSATSGYVWIVYPFDDTANTFTFSYGSGNRTAYGFAIVQGGGCIRYFQSATQLTRYSVSTITFSNQMVYIKFKI